MNYKLSIAALLVSCLSPVMVAAQPIELEVLHRWTSEGESRALRVIADEFEKGGYAWKDTAIAENQEPLAVSRTIGGKPPGVFQFNTGTDMDELVDAGLLRDFNAVAEAQNWQEILPDFIWDAITRNGDVYAVPLNIQSEVWMWYSTEVFEKSGAEIPATYDELFVALDKIGQAGFTPMAMGGQPWQEQLLFDKVLVGVAGPEFYSQLYGPDFETALASPLFQQAAQTYGRLRDYVDQGSPGLNWNVAASMVISGRAGIHVMGDWEKAEFLAAGQTIDQEFGCISGPGYKTSLVSGDIFVMPKIDDEGVIEAQDHLAQLILSEDMQINFNAAKGTMSVRVDIDTQGLDTCVQKASKEAILPAAYFNLSNDTRGALQDAITEFWNNPDASVDSFRDAVGQAIASTM